MTRQKISYCIIAGLFLLGLGGYLLFNARQAENKLVTESDLNEEKAEVSSGDIYVHITGALDNPGVVKLPEGSRLIDAIDALGGVHENADLDSLNLAAVLNDEDKIVIYTKEERAVMNPGSSESAVQSDKVNINTADLTQLKTLTGIGEAIGNNIIAYRTKNGSFKSIDEIKNVDRIGDKMFENIKDSITV